MSPMYNSNVLPDVTGRQLGAPDKQWDGFFRNITLTGSLSGSGLTASDVTNATPDVDSVNVQSDPGTGSLVRLRVTNPSTGPVLFAFKNGLLTLGGVDASDSPGVPVSVYSNLADTANMLNVYQRGSNVSLALAIDNIGRVISYVPGFNHGLRLYNLGDVNPKFALDAALGCIWGAGGNNALDTYLTRNAANALYINDGAGHYGNLALNILSSQAPMGTSPIQVISNALVTNLNADLLDGADWTAPPAIGSTTPSDVHAALLTASAQIQSSLNDGVTPPFSVLSAVPVSTLRVKFASDVTVENSVLNNGSGFKHRRVAIASLAAGAEINVVVTWTTAFADSSYTPIATVFDSGTSGGVQAGLRMKRITQQDATHIACK